MKYTLTTVFILLNIIAAQSQAVKNRHFVLSNYTYSHQNLIATITTTDGSAIPADVALKGNSAGLFKINGNKLYANKGLNSQDAKWLDVVITGSNISDTFRIVKDNFARNKVVAHRGAWKNTQAAQNSITSLQKAVELGCEGSEFDVQLSADSVIFVNHDPNIGDKVINQTPASELATIKLSNGEFLPTLKAYIQAGMQQTTTKLFLEIKKSPASTEIDKRLTAAVVNMVREMKAQAWVVYISFGYDIINQVIAIDPTAKVAYLNGDKAPDSITQFYGIDYYLDVLKKHPDWIELAHKNNMTVNVWTVDNPADMDLFLDKKADFITTNQPEILLKKTR